jgi:dinuclear metal center YbgI/SA1388 family protein
MRLERLVASLDALLESDGVRDYCPNGLQVEGRAEVGKIVTAVSASRALFTRAVDHDADAILVHHGLLWNASGPARVVGSFRDRLRLLLEHDLSLIAYHLPLDRHHELGNAAQMAMRLGLKALEPFAEHNGQTVGMCGAFPEPIEAEDFFALVAQACEREPQVFEGSRRLVSSVGIVTGGGEREYHQAVAAGFDAYITGEPAEWVMHQAAEDGVHFVAAGHYATERFGVQAVGRWLERQHGLEVEYIELTNPV